jgi:hypothetical protein
MDMGLPATPRAGRSIVAVIVKCSKTKKPICDGAGVYKGMPEFREWLENQQKIEEGAMSDFIKSEFSKYANASKPGDALYHWSDANKTRLALWDQWYNIWIKEQKEGRPPTESAAFYKAHEEEMHSIPLRPFGRFGLFSKAVRNRPYDKPTMKEVIEMAKFVASSAVGMAAGAAMGYGAAKALKRGVDEIM